MATFPEHALAHQMLDELRGLEIGAAAHNPFGLDTRNVAPPDDYEFYASSQSDSGLMPSPVHIWSTADAIPVPDDSEDFVLSSHVVEHLPNVIATFVEWNRIVRPGGFIFMIVPLRDALPADKHRPLTTLEHLIDDYRKGYNLDSHPTADVPGGRMGHYHVFTPEILLSAVEWMNEQGLCDWDLAAREDVDSKVGNGFTLAFRVHSKRILQPVRETHVLPVDVPTTEGLRAKFPHLQLPPLANAPTRTFGIIGTFDVDNYGDLLFPIVLERSMQRLLPGARLRLFSSRSGSFCFDDRPIHSLRQLETAGVDLDGFIFGGGDIVRFDRLTGNGKVMFNYEDLFINPLLCAVQLDRPFVWNAPGVPFEFTQSQKELVEAVLRLSDLVVVRDEPSRAHLGLDEAKCGVVPDTGFLVSQVFPKPSLDGIFEAVRERCALPPDYVAAHLSPATAQLSDAAEAAEELEALAERAELPIVLLPLGPVHGEVAFLNGVAAACRARFHVTPPLHPLETAALIARARAFVGTSLHGNITAFAYEVPATAVNTRDLAKLKRFGELTGRPVLSAWSGLSRRTDTLQNLGDDASRRADILTQIDAHLQRLTQALGRTKRSDHQTSVLRLISTRRSAFTSAVDSAREVGERRQLERALNEAHATIDANKDRLERQREKLAQAEAGLREKDACLQAMQRICDMERSHLGWRLLQVGRAWRDRLFPRTSWRWKIYRGLRAPLHFLVRPKTRTAIARFFGSFRLRSRDGLSRRDIRRMRARCRQMAWRPLISLITPVYNVDAAWLRAAIDSVLAQAYSNWELCLVNDASTAPHIRPLLEHYAARDRRIRVLHLDQNAGISGASNRALEMARGEFAALLDHDDALTPNALYEVAEVLNRDPSLDLIYSDEDKITAGGHCYDPVLKPDWDPLLLLTCNYICHLGVYRTKLIRELGGFRSEFDGSQDYDLVLRVGERTDRVAHIPKTLYHWRVIESSTASSPTAKPYAYAAARSAIKEALTRRGHAARVETRSPGTYRVHYAMPQKTKVSVLVDCPIASRAQLRSFEGLYNLTKCASATEFVLLTPEPPSTLADWPANVRFFRRPPEASIGQICNQAARFATGDYLVFLDGFCDPVQAEWLTSLLEQMQPGVAVVGARIIDADGRIVHAGYVIDDDGQPRSVSAFVRRQNINRLLYTDAPRRCSAVGAGCIMIARADFEHAGGFDERFHKERFDIDLCLRLRVMGREVVYTPWTIFKRTDLRAEPDTIYFEDHKLFNELWRSRLPARDPFCHGKVMNVAG